jgi:putative sigma-54 modulation protein
VYANIYLDVSNQDRRNSRGEPMILEYKYTGRQTAVTQKYRDQAKSGLKRIEKIVGGAASAHVVLTVDKYRKIADVTVTQGTQSMVAACESDELMTALHDALAKIEKQAIRQKQKTTTNTRHPRLVVDTMQDIATA